MIGIPGCSERTNFKSDNINKVVTNCYQLVPNLLTTWDKQCEDNLLADLLQDTRLSVFTRVNQASNSTTLS
jgi:hypothetical protein